MGVSTLLLAGAGMQAYGSIQSGKSQARNYQYQANIASAEGEVQARNLRRQAEADDFNAELARYDAKNIQYAAGLDEDKARRSGRQLLAAQSASMAQSGVSGFAAEKLQEQSLFELELDAMNIRYAGIMQSQGLIAEAQNYEAAAEQARLNALTARQLGASSALNLQSSASSARKAGYIGAASALLGGYTQFKGGR